MGFSSLAIRDERSISLCLLSLLLGWRERVDEGLLGVRAVVVGGHARELAHVLPAHRVDHEVAGVQELEGEKSMLSCVIINLNFSNL